MAKGITLGEEAYRKIFEASRRVLESQQGKIPDPVVPIEGSVFQRFKLLQRLEVGKFAIARKMVRIDTDRDPDTDEPPEDKWEYSLLGFGDSESDTEYLLMGVAGQYNYLPAGAECSAILVDDVWTVRMDELWAALSTNFDPFPYMVLKPDRLLSNYRDAIQLIPPGGVDQWQDEYVFTTGYAPPSLFDDTLPDEDARPRMTACTPILPAKAAYEPFDTTPWPQSILQAVGQGPDPSPGQLWLPGGDAKLHRTFQVLEFFWWELCAPDWQCVPGRVTNPDYDPFDPVCRPFNFDIYDPANIKCQATIDGDVWGIVCDGQVVARVPDPDGLGLGANLPCTSDPPSTSSGFFRSPVGWWGLGNWGWNWFWDIGWWNQPYGWWLDSPLWSDSWWWGPWGQDWWLTRWGPRPPTDDELLELTSGDIPDPPCGGGVLKRTRYGFVLWESGYRVLGSDTENKVCTVTGPLKTNTPFWVVENPDPPDTACGQSYY